MTKKEQQIADARTMLVVKSNELIQRSRFDLDKTEQKIVLYLISLISPADDDFKYYEFLISDFCRLCGIEYRSGKNYSDIKATVKALADKSLWVDLSEEDETLLRWVEKPHINKREGIIRMRLDNDMKPFLLQLKKSYTQYELIWTLYFKSKYSIRLYELVKSLHFHDLVPYEREYSLDEIKRILGAENYKTYAALRERVLVPATTEISEHSDKNVTFEPIKTGRAVTHIKLVIGSKDSLEAYKLRSEIEKDFGYAQLSLFDRGADGKNN